MATQTWVNFGPGCGLVHDGTKPWPDPMLPSEPKYPEKLQDKVFKYAV